MHRPLLPAVVYADEHLLVVDKPANVLSVTGRGQGPSLPELLRRRGLVPQEEPFFRVHRLDRLTSGLILFARTLSAQRHLTAQFAARTVEKVYLALVQGYVSGDGQVDLPLSVDKSGSRAVVDHTHGKPACTAYRVVERVAGHTLLECRPLTGRMHQIRIHLAAIGHPLAVDPVYGGGRALYLSAYKPDYKPSTRHPERPLIDRLTLHAARLAFDHPAGTGRVSFDSPLPKDFHAAVNQLRRVLLLAGRAADNK